MLGENKYNIAIAAGGSGGHIFPGIAIAQALKASNKVEKIIFIGRKEGLERKIIPHYGFPLYNINTSGLVGKNLFAKLKGGWQMLIGLKESLKLLQQEEIDLVVGTGGYVSAPVALAATCLRIPLVLHEQNAIPGKANQTLSHLAKCICASYASSLPYFPKRKCTLTGNPIRKDILSVKRPRISASPHPRLQVLVLGGSQGARVINEAICDAWFYLKSHHINIYFIHQTGEKDFTRVKSLYEERGIPGEPRAFIKDMADAYSQADMVISRAGATTLAEITTLGLPSILIPYPWATGHQWYNAETMAKAGASIVIPQEVLSGQRLAEVLINLIQDKKRLQQMGEAAQKLGKPQAAHHIADICIMLLEEKRRATTMA
ncbi:MAG: undecaprenyldiphospho-muramoylpentapeptide beta-N-acetylglucosaminyltransferase [Candidatus Desulfofervidaceae bacterium]|nr:undecaprenyldiphospho-muramoylpentapeptide beta-N-acetylglucosaminyltransferase [Candidatus Desulfofervidaceae bacterium]